VAQPPPGEAIPLTLHPAAAPSPALKYQLLPELQDQTPGNAALLYYRAFSPEWWGFLRQPQVMEQLDQATRTPLKDLLRQERTLPLPTSMLREVDRAARREYCDWELTDRMRQEGMGLLLPDIQSMRTFARLLAVRARLEIAHGQYDKAVYTLQTGFALARDVSQGPTLIQALVGIAIANLMAAQLEELLQAPDAPNFYWALTDLPRPFADLRKPLQGEKVGLVATLPELRDIETTPLTPQQERSLQKRLAIFLDLGEPLPPETVGGPGWKPWHGRLGVIGLVMKNYPEAKRALIAEGRTPGEVEALPALQVVLIHSLRQYRRLQDDLFKEYGLPYWEARPGLEQADRQLKLAKARMEAEPFINLLPAGEKVVFATARLDRRLAALRCVEALRLYAAAHDGQLPAALGDVSAVPVPIDPVTGKSFEYRVSGNKATLYAPPPSGEAPAPQNTLKYELTLQRNPTLVGELP
jgi:hypothetical protein